LDGALGLDGSNRSIDILGDNVSTVHHAAGHVLSVTGVALGHHAVWVENSVGDFSDRKHFVEGLFTRNDGSIRSQHKVDSWVSHQGGLEVVQIDIEGTLETKAGSQGRSDLGDQSVQVLVRRTLNVQVATAHVV
jgi:hypothetical protein